MDASGLVTAASNGAATITAAASAVCGTAAMTVDQVVASVAVTPPADTVVEADTVRLAAQAADANGHEVTETALSCPRPLKPRDRASRKAAERLSRAAQDSLCNRVVGGRFATWGEA